MTSFASKPRFGSRISVNLLISIQAMQCIFNVRSTSTINRMAALIGRDRATQKVEFEFLNKKLNSISRTDKSAQWASGKNELLAWLLVDSVDLANYSLGPKTRWSKGFFFCLSDSVTHYFQSPVKNEIKEQPTFELKQFDFPSLAKGA